MILPPKRTAQCHLWGTGPVFFLYTSSFLAKLYHYQRDERLQFAGASCILEVTRQKPRSRHILPSPPPLHSMVLQ